MYLNNSIIKSSNLEKLDNYSKDLVSLVFCKHKFNEQCTDCNKNTIDNTKINIIGDYKTTIKKEQFIEAINNFSISSLEGNTRILIIKGLDEATIVAQNVLLTWLENINSQFLIFFLTKNIKNIIQTVKSRLPIFDIDKNDDLISLNKNEEQLFHLLINYEFNNYINLYNNLILLEKQNLINILNKLAIKILQSNPDKKLISKKILKIITTLENQPYLNKKILIEKLLDSLI